MSRYEGFMQEQITGKNQATVEVTAPYNFAELPPFILPSVWHAQERPLDFGMPCPDAYSGSLSFEINSDGTPLLVGGSDNARFFTMNGQGYNGHNASDLAIPGSTIRGLIRTSLEVATAARITHSNLSRGHYDRDTRREDWPDYAANMTAAWLIPPRRTEKPLEKHGWHVRYGEMSKKSFAEIAQEFPVLTEKVLKNDTVRNKYQLIGLNNLPISAAGGLYLSNNQLGNPDKPKNSELHFTFDENVEPEAVDPEVISKFIYTHQQHPDSGNTSGTAFDFWWWMYAQGHIDGIPCGKFQNQSDIIFSTSRMPKVPNKETVGSLMARYRDRSLSANQLDFVQALFGTTPIEQGVERPGVGQRPLSDQSIGGRVSVSFARIEEPQRVAQGPTINAATMSPRVSFWPYYLRKASAKNNGTALDYNNTNARPAGWKRYAVREETAQIPPSPNDNAQIGSTFTFIRANIPNQPLKFRGTINFRNLLPEELGGLVWALTHGSLDTVQGMMSSDTYRHLLGRGKPFGYGRVKFLIDLEASRFEMNRPSAELKDRSDELEDCLKQFQQFCLNQYNQAIQSLTVNRRDPDLWQTAERFEDIPYVADCLAFSNPAVGLALQDRLKYPAAPNSQQPLIDGYKEIKDAAAGTSKTEFDRVGTQLLPQIPHHID